MRIGYRVFVVNSDNTVNSISQKSFNAFFLRGASTLKQFAGREIHVVVVLYTLANKKPQQIVKMDSQRLTVNSDGSLQEERRNDALHLSFRKISSGFSAISYSTPSEVVVDATGKFEERRLAQYHPQVSGPAMKYILRVLFGGNAS